jgi:hypothetical protein
MSRLCPLNYYYKKSVKKETGHVAKYAKHMQFVFVLKKPRKICLIEIVPQRNQDCAICSTILIKYFYTYKCFLQLIFIFSLGLMQFSCV